MACKFFGRLTNVSRLGDGLALNRLALARNGGCGLQVYADAVTVVKGTGNDRSVYQLGEMMLQWAHSKLLLIYIVAVGS